MRKIFILFFVLLGFLPASSFSAEGFFLGLRVGLFENFEKVVTKADGSELTGTFEGKGAGLTLGYRFPSIDVYFESSPKYAVVVDRELAQVDMQLVHLDYHFGKGNGRSFYAGLVAGNASFELEVGPDGRLFDENPTASGPVFGLSLGVQKIVGKAFYAVVLDFFPTAFSDSIDASDLDEIEIKSFYRINFLFGAYQFK